MKLELETVRNAVRDYQLELDEEKQSFASTLAFMQEELDKAMLDNEQLSEAAEACE